MAVWSVYGYVAASEDEDMGKAPRTYIAIDLKSFYASVECVDRGLDPLTTNLVVADPTRTEKTICLAVSPSLKAYGVYGRARLFEVEEKVREINADRRRHAPQGQFSGDAVQDPEVRSNPALALAYIVAPPRMAKYLEISAQIHAIYLRYVAPEDICVYSIDEVFIDATSYLQTYHCTPKEFAKRMILDVYHETGITATAGIGTNLYLCKVAMDILAKHAQPDAYGVRIAELDTLSYRQQLWTHRPLTDFWRVGSGYEKKLNQMGLYTMGDVALLSNTPTGEDLLYHQFGVNAELLIDHAWGWEPCTMEAIQAYHPASNSLSSGQVLQHPYTYEKGALIVREMVERLALDLVDKGLVTDQLVLTIGYDKESLSQASHTYTGEVTTDHYGRRIPKHAHGTVNLHRWTASTHLMAESVMTLYHQITDPNLLIRRVTIVATHITAVDQIPDTGKAKQMDLFTEYEDQIKAQQQESQMLDKESKWQRAALDIQHKYGKNALIKGMDLEEDATTIQRNSQIGGHKA